MYSRKFEAQLFASQYTNYFAVACLTILIADYLQTLDLEIALIWPTRWNLVKVMYFANRYLPLAFLPVIIFYNVAPGPLSPEACKVLYTVPCMGIAFCLLISEVILYIRVYALSGKTRVMVMFLVLHGGAVILTSLVLFAYYLVLGKFAPSPYPELSGCFGVSSGNSKYVVACFALVLYSGLVTMSLCIWCGLKTYWISKHSRLVKIFYRDGTFYFVMLVVLSLANGLVALLAPAKYRFMLAIPQEVMHNVITSRMILHLREHARTSMGFTSLSSDGRIDFDHVFSTGCTVDVANLRSERTTDKETDVSYNPIQRV
ncbi:hypothetical protein FA13DRAFT_7638 [Coprinellus micaceus]|uniref:DUF6533 domain-containing protein n=1 Tax=Coprinellus micaceus TaxID=71717 RepID=A0A4Y7U171_COPMI|nr:hypothetical protein FA13DRAFT_7638 [Coprinellus micaceus]